MLSVRFAGAADARSIPHQQAVNSLPSRFRRVDDGPEPVDVEYVPHGKTQHNQIQRALSVRARALVVEVPIAEVPEVGLEILDAAAAAGCIIVPAIVEPHHELWQGFSRALSEGRRPTLMRITTNARIDADPSATSASIRRALVRELARDLALVRSLFHSIGPPDRLTYFGSGVEVMSSTTGTIVAVQVHVSRLPTVRTYEAIAQDRHVVYRTEETSRGGMSTVMWRHDVNGTHTSPPMIETPHRTLWRHVADGLAANALTQSSCARDTLNDLAELAKMSTCAQQQTGTQP